ncbi:MAG: AmmeMemoRadiSam system radical SAM enzyme [Syntrophales bacterium]|nr:AmmeMemoRadiSam system radical SAM enzyme [Syntrophales bacterium]
MLSRRELLKTAWGYTPCLAGLSLLLSPSPARAKPNLRDPFRGSPRTEDYTGELIRTAPRARFWTAPSPEGGDCSLCHPPGIRGKTHRHRSRIVKCLLCAQGCVIREGERGKCRTRINIDGELRSLVYGRPLAVHVDPIEKKPFYHFLPGADAFSLGTAGCPLHCKFCQNWELSQIRPEDQPAVRVPPDKLVRAAGERRSPVIAFTYNEPTVFTEYLLDIARLAKKEGRRSVLVSCGFMNEAPLAEMCASLDAIKIDLKGISPDFYRRVCGAELTPVLRSIRQIAGSGTHLEIVNLVVPTLNDSDAMMKNLCDWVAGELGPDVPVHFSRFHPDYRMLNLPPTPVKTLERAREIAMARGIRYAYIGNVPGHPGNHTYCPRCRKVIIRRSSFFINEVRIKNGRCAFCGEKIAGVWS